MGGQSLSLCCNTAANAAVTVGNGGAVPGEQAERKTKTRKTNMGNS